jgi:hypothetical protein
MEMPGLIRVLGQLSVPAPPAVVPLTNRRGERHGPIPLPVAVIDGPYDAAALSSVLAASPVSLGPGDCDPDTACQHGTFVIGMLGARRDALIPGLCPQCQLLHFPLFIREHARTASLDALAGAIDRALAAGGKLINLSLAIIGSDARYHPALAAALDRVEANGALILAAAGNQGQMATGQLLLNPATIPVIAADVAGRALPDCNFGPSISHRGVAALGQNVLGYAAGGGTAIMSGTSVATSIACGIVAQVWSANPDRNSREIRAALASLGPRDDFMPPFLTAARLAAALRENTQNVKRIYASLQGGATMSNEVVSASSDDSAGPVIRAPNVARLAHGAECSCGARGGICTCGGSEAVPSRFIYVLGTVDLRFPDQSIAEEFESVARASHIVLRPDESLRNYYYRVLSQRNADGRLKARHVARQVCWLLKVEGVKAYYLSLCDLDDLPDLIECLRRPEPGDHLQPEHRDSHDEEDDSVNVPAKKRGHRGKKEDVEQNDAQEQFDVATRDPEDLDLFVGTSSLLPTEGCPGIAMPMLLVDQLTSFKKKTILSWCNAKAPHDPERLFRMLVQSADNMGDKDEWRALNFLAVQYKSIYEKYAQMANENFILESVKVIPSRLAREKHIVDPVFAFLNDNGLVRKYFVRVDVSYLYPMIVNHLTEYFDR